MLPDWVCSLCLKNVDLACREVREYSSRTSLFNADFVVDSWAGTLVEDLMCGRDHDEWNKTRTMNA